MKRMTTVKDHERRITALEANAVEVKETLASHSETLYDLKRFRVRTDLRFGKLFRHFGVEDVTEDQVDAVLDAE